MEADEPILVISGTFCLCPNIYLLELALHPWCFFYSEFHFVVI
jgi:hypothetical protein